MIYSCRYFDDVREASSMDVCNFIYKVIDIQLDTVISKFPSGVAPRSESGRTGECETALHQAG